MRWYKKLSRSDAQQKTKGNPMPFRFTYENCPGNFVTWFREEFFNNLDWKDTPQQEEEAYITISVTIQGEDLGQRVMRLTHAEQRRINHNAPATHLSFDEVTRRYLQDNNMTGRWIIFSKDDLTGSFKLVIQDVKP